MTKQEERADREEREGKFKEFTNINDLISELRGTWAMRPCNNLSCTTCLCDCVWRVNGY